MDSMNRTILTTGITKEILEVLANHRETLSLTHPIESIRPFSGEISLDQSDRVAQVRRQKPLQNREHTSVQLNPIDFVAGFGQARQYTPTATTQFKDCSCTFVG